MSLGRSARALGPDKAQSRLIVRAATRFVLSLGVAASLAVVTPVGGLATASASVVPAGHHGPGGGGNQGGGQGGGNQGGGNKGGGNQGGGDGRGGPGGFRHLVIVSGTVGTVGTTSFTLTRGFGPIMPVSLTGTATTLTGLTINVSQYTRFVTPGMTSHDLSDVLVGDKVTVTGRRAGSGMVNASLVVIPLELVTGAVGTVGGASFTIPLRPIWSHSSITTTLTGTARAWTIDVSGSTTYHERGVNSSTLSLASLSSADHVTVVGSQAGTLTLDAITVLIEPSHITRGGPGGGGGGGGSGGGGPPGGGKHHHR